jgi:hypothetical protein
MPHGKGHKRGCRCGFCRAKAGRKGRGRRGR